MYSEYEEVKKIVDNIKSNFIGRQINHDTKAILEMSFVSALKSYQLDYKYKVSILQGSRESYNDFTINIEPKFQITKIDQCLFCGPCPLYSDRFPLNLRRSFNCAHIDYECQNCQVSCQISYQEHIATIKPVGYKSRYELNVVKEVAFFVVGGEMISAPCSLWITKSFMDSIIHKTKSLDKLSSFM